MGENGDGRGGGNVDGFKFPRRLPNKSLPNHHGRIAAEERMEEGHKHFVVVFYMLGID
jgi:hypothetical protein